MEPIEVKGRQPPSEFFLPVRSDPMAAAIHQNRGENPSRIKVAVQGRFQ